MTWAQGTIAFCFGVLVPAVGMLCGLRLNREGKSIFKGLVLGSGTMIVALAGCCYLAIQCYPNYPRQEVPELLANAFTLPAIAAGIGIVWLISRERAVSRRFCTVASALLVALYIGGIFLCYEMFTWRFRKALPWSASEIHERYWTDTLLPNHSYQLKAKVTDEQFRRYVAKFGMTPYAPHRNYSDSTIWLNWRSPSTFSGHWWNPSDSLESTFVWQWHHTWTFAKYEHGYLYLASLYH